MTFEEMTYGTARSPAFPMVIGHLLGSESVGHGNTRRLGADYELFEAQAASLLEQLDIPGACRVLASDALLPTQLLSAMAQRSRWALAVAFLAEMARSSQELTVFHASAGVKACREAGRWEAALGLLAAAAQWAIQPNVSCLRTAGWLEWSLKTS